ncbi:MAG: GNVR domain-containing protein, partial [Planctomycetota bacterium]
DMLNAQALRRTSIIELSCRSEDPEAAVFVVNAVVASYLEYIDEHHKSESTKVVSMLTQERQRLEQQLAMQEQQLIHAKQSCSDLGLDGDSGFVHPSIQNVIKYNEALLEVQQRRIQLQASQEAISSALQSGGDLRQHLITLQPLIGHDILLSAVGLNPNEAAAMNELETKIIEYQAELTSLGKHYGPNHPEVQKLQNKIGSAQTYAATFQQRKQQQIAGMKGEQLGAMIASLVKEDLTRTIAQEKQMMAEYQSAQQDAKHLITQRSQITMLERALESKRELKTALINRIATLEISKNQANVRASVVSNPIRPQRPVSPLLPNVAVMALLAGLVASAGVVYVVDVIDDRFSSPEELQDQLGVPVLAMVRKHEITDGIGVDTLIVNQKPDAVESEAFRTLRTTLAFAGQDVNRLVVSSSEPSDGKTTVMSNLGVSYAQSGKRTLLIDCDLRRPGLTNMFDMRRHSGVAEILRSHDEIGDLCRDSVINSGVEGLDLIPSGRRPPDPAELLSRDRFAEMIAWAETEYD